MSKKKNPEENVMDPFTDLLGLIEQVSMGSRHAGSAEKLAETAGMGGELLAQSLECTPLQAALFTLVFSMNFSGSTVTVTDLAGHLDCEPLSLARHVKELDELARLGLLRRDRNDRRGFGRRSSGQNGYYVVSDIMEAVCAGKVPKTRKNRTESVGELLAAAGELMDSHGNREMDYQEFTQEMHALLHENSHLSFPKALKRAGLDEDSALIVTMLGSQLVQGNESVALDNILGSLFPGSRQQFAQRQRFRRASHPLLVKKLACFEAGSFRNEFMLKLTNTFASRLFEDDPDLLESTRERENADLVLHHLIPEKELFYSGEEARNLQFIEEALMPQNFRRLSGRLKEKGLCQGVSVLLYGPPGTGKTESVYQLARRTGRDIRQIDISETKSYWFGESEKIIKKLFDQYRQLAEKSKIAPILFFNEADGVFCRRREPRRSSTGQTENAIQNIILQEMENLKGILVATTNMAHNLDKAFERRFLYKVAFERPGMDARCRIWENRLPDLSSDIIRHLAEKYDFTGGQIDNVLRKHTMYQVIRGEDPEPQDIVQWCREENMQEEYKQVGFRL